MYVVFWNRIEPSPAPTQDAAGIIPFPGTFLGSSKSLSLSDIHLRKWPRPLKTQVCQATRRLLLQVEGQWMGLGPEGSLLNGNRSWCAVA